MPTFENGEPYRWPVWQREYQGEWVNDEMRAMPEATTWRIAPEEVLSRLQQNEQYNLYRQQVIEMQQISPIRWEPISSIQPPSPQTRPLSTARPTFNAEWIRANYATDYRPELCSLNNASGECPACEATREGAARKYDEMYNVSQVSVALWWDMLHDTWYNIALAHTAAYFMLDVQSTWNGDKFVNEKQLLTFAVAPDSAEGGDNR